MDAPATDVITLSELATMIFRYGVVTVLSIALIIVVHEFGHSLQLRHHFNDTDGSSDIKTHISPSCIMNYKYRSNEFCPLCKYGLGVN